MANNFKELGKQLLEIWRQLGLNQKVSVLLAAGVVLVGLGTIAFFSSRTSYETLYSGLDLNEAGKVIAVLEESGVPYETAAGGATVRIPRAQINAMRVRLAAENISGAQPGYELFDKITSMSSDKLQEAQIRRAHEGQIARTIMSLNEVDSAIVHVTIPSTGLIRTPDEYAKASVSISVRGNGALGRHSVQAITALVSHAVQGLKPQHVAISDQNGNFYQQNQEDGSFDVTKKTEIEKKLESKARAILDPLLGPGQSSVAVTVDLNIDKVEETIRKLDPTKQTVSETRTEETTDSSTGTSGSVPGMNANVVTQTNQLAAADTPQKRDTTTSATTEIVNDFGTSVVHTQRGIGEIRRISAAVTINQRFEGTGAERAAVPRTPEELDKIKQLVQSALGIKIDGLREDVLTLEELPFNTAPVESLNLMLERREQKEFWIDLGQKLLYPGLALLIIAMFWRSFKRTRVEEIPMGVPVGELNGGDLDDWKNGRPGVVTVDVLNRLVKENPGNMTHAIRTWLGKTNKNN